MNDLRFAIRQLRQSPGFVALAIFILSLGIAANVFVFSLLNGLYLRPLPFRDPARLVDLDETAPRWQLEYTGIAYPDFHAWRAQNRTFQGMGVWSSASFNLSSQGTTERISGLEVTHDLAEVLGLQPVLGRGFTADEDKPGGARVALLGYKTWQRLFAGQKDILGQVIRLDGQPYTVIGVLPVAADFPDANAMWIPLGLAPDDGRGWFLQGVGRLKPDVSLDQARADLLRIHKGMVETRQVNEITSPRITPLRERYLGDSRLGTAVLFGAVVLVLAIGCANVAALMLARGLARSREMGVRLALGATRLRIARQVLVESLVLALLAGLGGTLLSQWLMSSALSWLPSRLPVWVTLELDARFGVYFVGLTALVAVLFGVLPSLQAASRLHLHGVLSSGSARLSGSAARRRSLHLLVAGEVALASLLLILAGLFARGFLNLQKTEPGFRPDHLLTYRLSLPEEAYPQAVARHQFFAEHLEKVCSLPGVTGASAVTPPPLEGHWGTLFEAEGAPPKAPGSPDPVVLRRVVYPGYLETLGVRLLAGRDFTQNDGPDSIRVVVVNDLLAQLFWPGQDAVGKRIRYAGANGPWIEVVGVVEDVKHYGLDKPMRPGVYLPASQDPQASMAMVVRTSVEPNSLLPSVRDAVKGMNSDLAVHGTAAMTDRLRESLWVPRFFCWSVGVFSAVALLLSVGGIYGVVSFVVVQRTSEIGIRVALGAQRGDVLRLVLGQGLKQVTAGLGCGVAGALVLAHLLSRLLFGLQPADALTFTAVPILLAGAALAAGWVPARRALRIDPVQALRSE